MKLSSLILTSKASLIGALKVFKRPSYIVLAISGAILSSSFILWSLNLDLVKYIVVDAPISFADKLNFFWSVYKDIFTTYESLQALGLVVFSILFGINLSLITFAIKNQGFKNVPKKSGFGGLALAIVGGGCVACGTSLLAPLLATFGAVSGAFLRELSLYLNWIGSLLMIYSIYKLGLLANYIRTKETLDKSNSL